MRHLKVIMTMCLVLCLMSGCKVKEAAGAYRPAKAKSTTTNRSKPSNEVSTAKPVVSVVKKDEPKVEEQPEPVNNAAALVESVNFTTPVPEPVPVVEPVQPEVIEIPEPEAEKVVTRTEAVSVVPGQGSDILKPYNVVIGSFGSKANAERLKSSMQAEYNPVIVINEKGMYRVILASYDEYNMARELINRVKGKFADAWVLIAK